MSQERMHPQDLRVIVAAIYHATAPEGVPAHVGIDWADSLLEEMKRAENPKHMEPFVRFVPRDRVDEIVRRAEAAEAQLAEAKAEAAQAQENHREVLGRLFNAQAELNEARLDGAKREFDRICTLLDQNGHPSLCVMDWFDVQLGFERPVFGAALRKALRDTK